MAFGDLGQTYGAGGQVRPRRPDAQGYQGATAQPNTTSSLQGPAGATASAPPTGTRSSGTASTAPATGGHYAVPTSPVLSNGQIPPPAAQAAPAPAPTPQAAPAPPPTPSGPADPNFWVTLPGGGRVPYNHPLAQTPGAQGPMAPTQPAPTPPVAPAQQALANVVNGQVPGVMGQQYGDPTQLSQNAAPVYSPYQFTQFGDHQVPGDPQTELMAQDLMRGILRNPHSMNQGHVAILQEQQKEQALAQQDALMAALGQQRALSGFEAPGGAAQAQMARVGQGTQNALLQGNRDIALAKMQQDRADELAALGASQDFQNAGLNRSIAAFGALHQGQAAQAGQGLQAYGSQSDAYNNHQSTALAAQQLALQKLLGEKGIGLDEARLNQQGSQFDKSHQLQLAALMNDMLMGRANYGLNLLGAQQGAQNNIFGTIFGRR